MRESLILAQAHHAAIAGRSIAYPSCFEDVQFFPEGGTAPRSSSIAIGIPALAWPPSPWEQMGAFMAHRLAHVSDQPNWFRLSDGLADRLMTTELRGLTPADVRLPFHTLVIEVPDGLLGLSDPETGFHAVRCIFVADCDGSASVRPTAMKGRHLTILARCAANERSVMSLETLDVHFRFPLMQPDAPLREQDVETAAQYAALVERKGRLLGREVEPLEARQLIVQLVLNTCLYLSSANAEVRHVNADAIARNAKGKDIKKLRRAVREHVLRLERERVFVVGSSVQVNGALREQLARSGGTGTSLAYRTVVRGHWKRQAFGEGRSERKTMWIQPYVRGSEALPEALIGHSYQVA